MKHQVCQPADGSKSELATISWQSAPNSEITIYYYTTSASQPMEASPNLQPLAGKQSHSERNILVPIVPECQSIQGWLISF